MREYGIDLVADLPRLTLRRFMVLVRGLGPASAVANRAGGAPRPGARRPAWRARRRSRRPCSRASSAAQRASELMARSRRSRDYLVAVYRPEARGH